MNSSIFYTNNQPKEPANILVVDKNKVLVAFDTENYQKFLQMIEKEQKVRDRAYQVWKETHEVYKPRKRKEPLQFQLLKA